MLFVVEPIRLPEKMGNLRLVERESSDLLPWQRSRNVLVNDEPFGAALFPDGGVTAFDLHRAACLGFC